MTHLLLDDENDANLKQTKDNLPWCFHQQPGFVVVGSYHFHKKLLTPNLNIRSISCHLAVEGAAGSQPWNCAT